MTKFVLNDTAVEVSCPPATRLLYALRNDLGMKAAKFGCGLGQCGACTVLVDGRPIQSCDVAVEYVAGRKVQTVEGLGDGKDLHPLQQAFVDEQAAQCGYCTPGILMTAWALLQHNADPSTGDIKSALDRNLCRCGSHGRVIRAIQRAARALRESPAR